MQELQQFLDYCNRVSPFADTMAMELSDEIETRIDNYYAHGGGPY